MVKRFAVVLVAVVAMWSMSGCSKAPVTEIDAGKAALENAKASEAEMYAPELFQQASDSLNAATVAIQEQDAKFSMFRDYDRATEMLAKSQQLAEQAIAQAAAEKERVRVADSVMAAEIVTMITDTRALLAKAPRGKGTSTDLKVLGGDLDAAQTALDAAMAEWQTGQYLAVQQKLEAVKAQVSNVKTQIDAALAKVKK